MKKLNAILSVVAVVLVTLVVGMAFEAKDRRIHELEKQNEQLEHQIKLNEIEIEVLEKSLKDKREELSEREVALDHTSLVLLNTWSEIYELYEESRNESIEKVRNHNINLACSLGLISEHIVDLHNFE